MNKYFCYKKLIIFSILFINSIYSYATNFTIDFKNGNTYIESIETARRSLGGLLERFNTIADGANVRGMTTPTSNRGHIITIRNLYGNNTDSDIRFVLDPNNLYLAGFIYNGRYYRFNDLRTRLPDNIGGNIELVELRTGSSYTTLRNVGDTTRLSLHISNSSLFGGLSALMNWADMGSRSLSLDQNAARAMIRYATVISEALRFRRIAAQIASVVQSHGNFRLNSTQIGFTLNWASGSNAIRYAEHSNDSLVTMGTTIHDAADIAKVFALLLLATPANSRNLRAVNSSIDRWSFQRGTFRTKNNHTYWDNRVFILAVLD